MANNQSSITMSPSMNMAITIFGFALSAMFMLVICGRLLCSRVRHRNTLEMLQPDRSRQGSSSVERNLQGMEPSLVASFPTIKYNQQVFTTSEDSLCTICLGDYKEKEVLRVLPRCGHAFHVSCIDVWLRQHSTCPVCRISLRIFPEWRRMHSSLISFSARSRFVPGALPDSMFETRSDSRSLPVGVPTGVPGESVDAPVPSDRVAVEGNGGMELAEPSISGHNDTTDPIANGSIEDMEKILELEVNPVFDSPSKDETTIMITDAAAKEEKATSVQDGLIDDTLTKENSVFPSPDRVFNRDDGVRLQIEGPSYVYAAIYDKEGST